MVGEEYLCLSVWLVVLELTTVDITILPRQSPISFPGIQIKLTFVLGVFLGILAGVILYVTTAVHLTFHERATVYLAIRPLLHTHACYLSILKLSGVGRAIAHQ